MGKHSDSKCSVGRGWSMLHTSPYGWTDGVVVTPHGFVDVYAEDGLTNLSFIWGGSLFIRSFPKRYSERGIATKAKQFAAEVAPKPEGECK